MNYSIMSDPGILISLDQKAETQGFQLRKFENVCEKITELLACKPRPVLKCVAALMEIVLHNMIKEQDLISYILVLVF